MNNDQTVVITSKGAAMLVLVTWGVPTDKAIAMCDALEIAGAVGVWPPKKVGV